MSGLINGVGLDLINGVGLDLFSLFTPPSYPGFKGDDFELFFLLNIKTDSACSTITILTTHCGYLRRPASPLYIDRSVHAVILF